MVSPHTLQPAHRNARTHPQKQIEQIAESIRRFGIISPLVADNRGRLVAGHARAEAAKLIGLKYVPVIRVEHLTQTEIRAYVLADNKLAEKAGWDREALAIELGELQVALPEIDLDIGITGFEPGEIDAIMVDFAQPEGQNNPIDEIPETEAETSARIGDLFVLGRHRLLVGDARDESAYRELMDGETAEMAFLDPPYNVRVQGHVGGRGRIKHQEFACASGEMTSPQFVRFLQ